MKKIVLIFIVVLAASQNLFSQERDRKVTIQTNPLLLFSDINVVDGDSLFAVDLEGQFKLTNYSNIAVTLSFLTCKNTFGRYEPYVRNVYQADLKPMYIYRPFGTGIKGLYLGFYPHFGFMYVNDNKEKDQLFFEYGFGINLGYKWVFNSGFTLQLGGGIGKTFSSPEKKEEYVPMNSDGSITMGRTYIQLMDFKLGFSF